MLLAILAISIITFFSSLSQYPTGDQNFTSGRLHKFLSNPGSVVLFEGSLVSDLVVAVPGQLISRALDGAYNPNDPIVGTIHLTPYLPFAIPQVLVALVLIWLLARLFVKLTTSDRPDALIVLFALVVILNFPMLKALSKILKYDVLSTLFSAIAVVLYIAYRKFGAKPPAAFFGRYCIAAIGTCCGLAYLEKDSASSTGLLIVFFELTAIPFLSTSAGPALRQAAGFSAKFAISFLATTILFVPKIWLYPFEFGELFANLHLYFVNVPKSVAPIMGMFFVLIYVIGPNSAISRRWPAIITGYFWALGSAIFVLAGSALVFQENIIFDPTVAGNSLDIAQLQAQSIYISKPMADASMTTLDHSAMLQHAKILWSMVRSIVYTLPEISVVMIVGAAPLFLFLVRRRPALLDVHGTALALLAIFPVAPLAALSLVEMPLDPKYLVLVGLLITMYGLYPVLLGFRYLAPAAANMAQALICILTIISVLPVGPTYLGYKNLFRDRNIDNAAALDMDRFIWWTWAGWGETAYAIGQFVEQHRSGPARIAYDYLPPFYSAPGLEWVKANVASCQSEKALDSMLMALQELSVDYLVVSRNMSNRNWCENQILRRTKDVAVFVDERQGFEYGWLLRLSDVVARNCSGDCRS